MTRRLPGSGPAASFALQAIRERSLIAQGLGDGGTFVRPLRKSWALRPSPEAAMEPPPKEQPIGALTGITTFGYIDA
jgi:hypothetical protein